MTRPRALVADDDPELLTMVSKAVARFGADVVAVTSGGELLDKLADDGAFDVIVTDVSMPWMTGLQVMHSARTAGLPVPVIVITALRDPTLPAQVTALGARAELLHKPFSIEELYAALRRCLAEPAVTVTPPSSIAERN
jgi:two-component system, cell cycle response regulator CpdR